jgi:ribosome maturation factor RimP
MIKKQEIEKLVEENIKDTEMFLVSIDVSQSNKITVLVDSNKGVSVKDCVKLSRHIEANYDRDVEDYDLEVSSPGLDKPFAVKQQYVKNIGRQVKIKTGDSELKGLLKSADDSKIIIETERKEKIEGKKKKEIIKEDIELLLSNVKSAKVVISFK